MIEHLEAGAKRKNEDRSGISGRLAWVIDGATGVTADILPGAKSDASWYAQELHEELALAGQEDVPMPLLATISMCLERLVKRAPDAVLAADVGSQPSATVGIVRHAGEKIEQLVLGDVCLYSTMTEHSLTDQRIAPFLQKAEEILVKGLKDNQNFDLAFKQASDELRMSRARYMNQSDGYWVASLDSNAARHALLAVDPIIRPTSYLLCTDGFSRLWDLFGLVGSPATLFNGMTLRSAARLLREVESADPQCIQFPRWGAHDDIAAFVLEPVVTPLR